MGFDASDDDKSDAITIRQIAGDYARASDNGGIGGRFSHSGHAQEPSHDTVGWQCLQALKRVDPEDAVQHESGEGAGSNTQTSTMLCFETAKHGVAIHSDKFDLRTLEVVQG